MDHRTTDEESLIEHAAAFANTPAATNISTIDSTSCPTMHRPVRLSASPPTPPEPLLHHHHQQQQPYHLPYHHRSVHIHHPSHSTSQIVRDVDAMMASRKRLLASGTSTLYDAQTTGANDDGGEDYDSLNEVVIDDLTATAEPTSVMLHLCKRHFLRPLVHLLGAVGLRPLSVEAGDCSFWLGHAQTLIVLAVLLFGYVLQYVTSFRRDRGIWHGPELVQAGVGAIGAAAAANRLWNESPNKTYYGENDDDGIVPMPSLGATAASSPAAATTTTAIVLSASSLHLVGEALFVYCVPAVLHCGGFAMALYGLRIADNEHLQNLVERVFIQCSTRAQAMRMVAALWAYVAAGVVWLALMTGAIVWPELMTHGSDDGGGGGPEVVRMLRGLHWMTTVTPVSEDALRAIRWLLLVAVFVHDLVQMVVITMYAIQCYLLRGHLALMREKLLQNTVEPMDWMREMGEFRKLLHHVNRRIAAPVCWFTLMNMIYTLAAMGSALTRYAAWTAATGAAPPLAVMLTNAGNVALWLTMALVPFFQAAAVTLRCQAAQTSGHQVRVRPFGHHNTSAESLNAVLLYASSLRMSAMLFRMPIQGNYLYFAILCLVVAVLTLGMCLNATLTMGV